MSMMAGSAGGGSNGVQPYKPDGGYTLSGVIMLFSGLIVVGQVAGYVSHLIGQYFWLIVLFPFFIGLALGAAGRWMVKQGHVRNVYVAALAGLVAGVLSMVMMHYFDYRDYRTAVGNSSGLGPIVKLTPDERKEVFDGAENKQDVADVEEALVAYDSFPAFMNFEAKQGVEISNHGSKGINLGFYGSYIYWVCEVLIVAGVCLFVVYEAAGQPYCPACSAWKTPRRMGGFKSSPFVAKEAIRTGQTASLGDSEPTLAPAPIVLTASTCPNCRGSQSGTDLKLVLETVKKDGKKDTTVLANSTWPTDRIPSLEAIFIKPESTEPGEVAPR